MPIKHKKNGGEEVGHILDDLSTGYKIYQALIGYMLFLYVTVNFANTVTINLTANCCMFAATCKAICDRL